MLQTPLDGGAQALPLPTEILALEVLPEAFDRVAPARRVPTDDRAEFFPLAETRRLAKVDLPLEARAGIAAGVSDQRPADRLGARPVMVDVLLGFIRVVPFDLGFKAAGIRIEFHRREIGSHDGFERVGRSEE